MGGTILYTKRRAGNGRDEFPGPRGICNTLAESVALWGAAWRADASAPQAVNNPVYYEFTEPPRTTSNLPRSKSQSPASRTGGGEPDEPSQEPATEDELVEMGIKKFHAKAMLRALAAAAGSGGASD